MLSGTAAQLIRSIDAFPVHRLVGGIFLLSLEKFAARTIKISIFCQITFSVLTLLASGVE
jgi:hypothetical protein